MTSTLFTAMLGSVLAFIRGLQEHPTAFSVVALVSSLPSLFVFTMGKVKKSTKKFQANHLKAAIEKRKRHQVIAKRDQSNKAKAESRAEHAYDLT